MGENLLIIHRESYTHELFSMYIGLIQKSLWCGNLIYLATKIVANDILFVLIVRFLLLIFKYRVDGQMANFGVKYVPPKVFIKRTELIVQLNSAPLITHEAVKGPSERPLNPTPTVFNISTEISQKYNTTSKEVILNNLRDFRGWNDSLLHRF